MAIRSLGNPVVKYNAVWDKTGLDAANPEAPPVTIATLF